MSLLTNPLAAGVSQEYNVVWQPLPDIAPGVPSSQALALDSRADQTLLCGTRGGGKTETQLMRFRRRVGLGYGSAWRGVIFDREYKNLDDLVAKSKKLFKLFGDGARFISSKSDYKWVWPTGEELLFRAVSADSDYDDYHGHEYPFIGWNELTKQPTSRLYDKFMSCNRSSFLPEEHTPRDKQGNYATPDKQPLPPMPLEVFSTTNPSGIGHNWVKDRFIDVGGPYGTVIRTETVIENPQTGSEETIITTQVAIFSHWRENRYLDPKYIANLKNETDENLRMAWYTGSWDVTSGGAWDDLWRRDVHILPTFNVPASWRLDRAFDWGSTHPFACLWFAEANGEEARYKKADGSEVIFCPPPGSLIVLKVYYGAKTIKTSTGVKTTNEGLRMSATDVAENIKAREIEAMRSGFFHSQPWRGPADNEIRAVKNVENATLESKMASVGIHWTESDKSTGSRRVGMQLFRDMLEATLKDKEMPRFYVMDVCKEFIKVVPTLPRDEVKIDDVDTTSEDHMWDALRYKILSKGKRPATKLKINVAS